MDDCNKSFVIQLFFVSYNQVFLIVLEPRTPPPTISIILKNCEPLCVQNQSVFIITVTAHFAVGLITTL